MFPLLLLIQFAANGAGAPPGIAPPPGAGPTYVGSLDKDTIRRVVEKSHVEIRVCYERLLKSMPDDGGKVVVFWRIEPSGAVASASIEETSILPRDQTFEACIVDVVSKMRFPAPKGGGIVLVHFPFVFRQNEPRTGPNPHLGQPDPTTPPPAPPADLTGPVTLALFGVAIAAIIGVAVTAAVLSAQSNR